MLKTPKGMIYILRRIDDFFYYHIIKPMLNFADRHPFIEKHSCSISITLSILSIIIDCINKYFGIN